MTQLTKEDLKLVLKEVGVVTKDNLKPILKEFGVVTKNDLKEMGVVTEKTLKRELVGLVTEKALKRELNKTTRKLQEAIANVALNSPTI
ncbi:MAG: hypothetical protein NTV24_00645 [Candidatus Woesebacteria bacterium]|nr:hypothetical protein [Candidatus Woesebacteria bacterium]